MTTPPDERRSGAGCRRPTSGRKRRGVLCGGAYGYGPDQARTWYQAFEGLQTTCPDVGFRTVLDAEPLR